LLLALAIGGLFVAGLFIDGRVGGGLLLVTDALLIGLSRLAWNEVNPRRRPIRVLIIVAITVLAVVKLTQG
jgi:hypothetical protein